MFIIYQITNKVNGKRYIGKTGKTAQQRWKEHVSAAFYETARASLYFYCAIRKYGANSFEIKEIDKTNDRDVVDYLESFWITAFKTYDNRYGYNRTFGGDGGSPTEETKAKISASLIGRPGHPSTPEINAKISAANQGRKPSKVAIENARLTRLGKPANWINGPNREEVIAKIKLANVGRTFSEETRLKMRQAKLGRKLSPEAIEKLRIAHTGLKRTEEQKERMKLSKKGTMPSPQTYEASLKAHKGARWFKDPNNPGKRLWYKPGEPIPEYLITNL